MKKLLVALRNFANSPKKISLYALHFLINIMHKIQDGARNVMPLIVHVTHFYYYKNI